MKTTSAQKLYDTLYASQAQCPRVGTIELTYRCTLDCVHCYCKGSEDRHSELSTDAVKKLLDDITAAGCFQVVLTGGDPLIRDDFLDIYLYARRKGLLITVFTNGQLFSPEIIECFTECPPVAIEITLNGCTAQTYESITGVPGSFARVMETIQIMADRKIPLILKTNCMRQNFHELGAIKRFTDTLLGKNDNRYHFKYDPMIYPRLNGDRTPTHYRLSFDELLEMRRQDEDIWEQYMSGICAGPGEFDRGREFLYRCTTWMHQFTVSPFGRLRFCMFSDEHSIDLARTSFEEGFYTVFPRLCGDRFSTSSSCQHCESRSVCYTCPARAALETGDPEAPVEYFCELAKKTYERMNVGVQ